MQMAAMVEKASSLMPDSQAGEPTSCPVEPYAIRAIQSHSGQDLSLHLMHKQITLDNDHILFGAIAIWKHQANGGCARMIVRGGLFPGGYEYLDGRSWTDLDRCKPIHLVVRVGGEFDMLAYPHKECTLACDSVEILLWDEACQDRARKAANEITFTGVYISPISTS